MTDQDAIERLGRQIEPVGGTQGGPGEHWPGHEQTRGGKAKR